MRYKGRVVVSKVDEEGNKIKILKTWIKNNPGKIYFDSIPEWEVWDYLRESDIDFTYQPKLDLFSSVVTQEFEKPRQTVKAKKEKRNKREIKKITQKPIGYTPDFYLKDFDLYIEVKGWADDVFKLRWKLFKLKGYDGFIVYSLDEFKQLYKHLREDLYKNRI